MTVCKHNDACTDNSIVEIRKYVLTLILFLDRCGLLGKSSIRLNGLAFREGCINSIINDTNDIASVPDDNQ